jgi:hypothetical protein
MLGRYYLKGLLFTMKIVLPQSPQVLLPHYYLEIQVI